MSFYRGPIKNTTPSDELSIEQVFDLVSSDTYKDEVTLMRGMTEDEYNKRKERLDYITPAGVFETRKESGILELSGYAPIDIDKVGADVNNLKMKLKTNHHIALLFISPSGRGLKAIIKVPDDEHYSEYVEAFYNQLTEKYGIDDAKLDKKTRDISRACFLSYDPNAHLNLEAKVFDRRAEKKQALSVQVHRKVEGWVEDFLLKYCTVNRLPVGERHTVIEKNLAALIKGRADRDETIKQYQSAQGQGNFNGWLSNDKYCEVNAAEIAKYIKRYNIPFTIPEPTEMTELKNAVMLEMAQRKLKEATELIVQFFLEHNRVYTTRDDIASEVWIYADGIYVPQGKTYIKEFVREVMDSAFNTFFCNQVIAKIEADTFTEQSTFFNSWTKEEIIVLNGILNLETRELSEYTPDKIFFNKIPVIYDPTKDCPAIDAHFHEVLKYEGDVPVMYEIFGFILWKEYFIEKAIMFSGSGRNGKGKTIELMTQFVGIENTSHILLQQFQSDKFATISLFNKLVNVGADIGHDALIQTSIFKGLTGRDEQEADRKFQSRIKFKNHAKMIFSANEIPKTHDNTPAFWNRWVLIEFPYEFLPQKEIDCKADRSMVKLADPNIVDKMATQSEMSGLMNKALDGLDRLRENGDFSYSKNTTEVKNMWIRKSDSFAAFISEMCESDYDSYIKKDEMSESYSKYCREYGLKPMGEKSIKKTMENSGYWDSRKNEYDDDHGTTIKVSIWNGLKFKEKVRQETIKND